MECKASGKIEKSEKIKSSGNSGRAERREKSGFCIREEKKNVLEDKKKLFCKRAEKRLPATWVGTKETGAERVFSGGRTVIDSTICLCLFCGKHFRKRRAGGHNK